MQTKNAQIKSALQIITSFCKNEGLTLLNKVESARANYLGIDLKICTNEKHNNGNHTKQGLDVISL